MRTGIMLAKPISELYLSRMPDKVLVQPKLDGARCLAVPSDRGYTLVSSQGNKKAHLPHIEQELNTLATMKLGSETSLWPTFDGELYLHGMSRQKILSRIQRTVNPHPEAGAIEYWMFDIVSEDVQIERIQNLNRFPDGLLDHLKIVLTDVYPNKMEMILAARDHYRVKGFEGCIVRDPYAPYQKKRTDKLLKCKVHEIITGSVLGFEEAVSLEGYPKGMVGSIIVDCAGGFVNVSAGRLTHDQRIEIWENQERYTEEKWTCHYWHTGMSDDGIPLEPRCDKLVKEK